MTNEQTLPRKPVFEYSEKTEVKMKLRTKSTSAMRKAE